MTVASTPLNANSSPTGLWLVVRYGVSVLLLCVSLVAALLFYGPSYNLLFAWVASLSSCGALLLAGPARFAAAWRSHSVAVPLSCIIIVLLFVQHILFAQSPETSYPVVWIIAGAPIACLTWLVWSAGDAVPGLSARVPLHFVLPAALAAVLAVIALVRFVGWNVRPHDPLVDASGFGTLMYLAWVPAAHHWLVGAVAQQSGQGQRWRLGTGDWLMMLLAGVVLIVLFATASVACAGLLGCIMLAWSVLALRGRVCWRRLLMLVVIAGAAYGYTYSQSPALQTSMDGGLVEDAATEQRMLLVAAALNMLEASSLNGSGLFSYAAGYAQLRTSADQTSDGSFVHNDYLQLLVEGGLWLFVPALLFTMIVALRSVSYLLPLRVPGFSDLRGDSALRAGGWFALGMVCVHMLVNFVLYTMALAMAMGLLAAWACTKPPATESVRALSKGWFAAWLLGSFLGVYGLGLFALDVMSASVFSGQPSLFGSASFRQSGARQVFYAVRAESINGDRATPVLAQGLYAKALLEHTALDATAQAAQFHTAIEKFEQARALDPGNLAAYLGHAALLNWLAQQPAPGELAVGMDIDSVRSELLEEALRRDPRNLEALAALSATSRYANDPLARYELLKSRFYPWLTSHWRQSRDEASQWLNQLAVLARHFDDETFFTQMRLDRERLLAQVPPTPYKSWFIEWQQRGSGS